MFLHVKKKAQVLDEKVQSQITMSLQNERAFAQWVFQMPFESLRDNFASICPGHWRFVFYVLLFHFVSLAQVFCTSSLCIQTWFFSSFSFDLLHLRPCWAHASTTVPPCPPQTPLHPPPMSEWVIDYSNPPTYFISAALCRARDVEVCGVGMASFAIFILTFFLSSEDSYSVHIL